MVLDSSEIALLWVQDGNQGIAGQFGYTWIKYSKLEDHSDISDDESGAVYIGIAYNKTESTESTNPADYQWTKIIGDPIQSTYTVFLDNEYLTFSANDDMRARSNQRFIISVLVFKGTTQVSNFTIDQSKIVAPKGLEFSVDNNAKTISVSTREGWYFDASNGNVIIPVTIENVFEDDLTYLLDLKYTLSSISPVTSYYWIKYADNALPTSEEIHDETSPTMVYVGLARNKNTPQSTLNYTDYEWLRMENRGAKVEEIYELYHKSVYNDPSYIPSPTSKKALLNLEQGVIAVSEGGIGYENWTEKKPEQEEGYYLWSVLRLHMSDGTYLYSTPLLNSDWDYSVKRIGGRQLIRNSKTLIDSRIYLS